MRKRYELYIHSSFAHVRMVVREELQQANPNFKAQNVHVFHVFEGFRCSVYHILSGKLTRVFRSVLEAVQGISGVIDKTAFIVQYVSHNPYLLAASGTATNVVPLNAVLYDSNVDFLDSGVMVGALVTNTTDGSTALVQVVSQHSLETAVLTNGVNNTFSPNDAYTVHNYNDLKVDDQIYIDGKWRTVLAVVHDSWGIQTSTMVSE